MKEMNSRQKQAIEKKLKITSAAMELFSNGNFNEVKIADICKKAECSVGLFYHYFESKEDIIREGYAGIDTLIQESFSKIPEEDPLKRISIFMRTCGEIITKLGVNFVSNAYRQCLLDDQEFTTSKERIAYGMIENLVETAIVLRKLQVKDSKAFISLLNRMARGDIFEWCLKFGSFSLPDLMEEDTKRILSLNM